MDAAVFAYTPTGNRSHRPNFPITDEAGCGAGNRTRRYTAVGKAPARPCGVEPDGGLCRLLRQLGTGWRRSGKKLARVPIRPHRALVLRGVRALHDVLRLGVERH